ncbi:MAG: hypothetical protein M3Y48_12070 [Actinomycetota bacterium]|nr:hypothetical protein [Actinomycetota bacterium]
MAIDGMGQAFPAVVAGERWNGWARPAFDQDVARQVVEWINTTHAENPDALVRAQWDGDVIVITDPNTPTIQAISPTGYHRTLRAAPGSVQVHGAGSSITAENSDSQAQRGAHLIAAAAWNEEEGASKMGATTPRVNMRPVASR